MTLEPSEEFKAAYRQGYKLAFDQEYKGFRIIAFWPPKDRDALVEITRNGESLRAFNYPAYKIFNLAAHFHDIVEAELIDDCEQAPDSSNQSHMAVDARGGSVNKAEEIVSKWVVSTTGDDFWERQKVLDVVSAINEALEWAAQQCEAMRDEEESDTDFHKRLCHDVDAEAIRDGKSKP